MAEAKQEDNVVLVGNKPAMSYVLAVVTQFNEKGNKEVTIKARGRAISRAVDVAEIVRNRFLPDVKVKDISIATDNMKSENGQEVNVSSITIVLSK